LIWGKFERWVNNADGAISDGEYRDGARRATRPAVSGEHSWLKFTARQQVIESGLTSRRMPDTLFVRILNLKIHKGTKAKRFRFSRKWLWLLGFWKRR
jgi:hypothetical protein